MPKGRALGGLLAVTAIVGGALVEIGVSIGIVVAPAIAVLLTVVVAADQLFSRVGSTGGDDDRRAGAAIEEAAVWPPPRVRDLDRFQLGVLRSGIAERHGPPSYVGRDRDQELDEAIRTRKLVVVGGQTKAGKSRTAFEALHRCAGDRPVLVAQGRAPLKVIASALASAPETVKGPIAEAGPGPVVVWLDAVAPFVATGDLTASMLTRLERGLDSLVVLGTLSDTEHRELDDGARGQLEALLADHERCKHVVLERALSDAELGRARSAYPDLAERPSFRRGMAEFFAAAPLLYDRYRKAADRAEGEWPARRAIVDAVLDWRRAGMDRPIPEIDLRQLTAIELRALRPDQGLGGGRFEAARDWACTPLAATSALLEPRATEGDTAYAVPDSLYDREGLPRAVSGDVLAFVLTRVGLPDALAVGAAAARAGHFAEAVGVLESLARSDSPEAPHAALRLAEVLERDEPQRAAEEYRRLLPTRDPAVAVEATLRLARLLRSSGNDAEARDILWRAIAADDPEVAPAAALELGRHLNKRGELEGALGALRVAAEAGHPDASPAAALLAGDLLLRAGDGDGAAGMWRLAAGFSPHPAAIEGVLRHARLMLDRGRSEAAVHRLSTVEDEPSGGARALRAEAFLRLRRWEDALRDAEVARTRLRPEYRGRAVRAEVIARIKLGQVGDALRAADDGVRAKPDDPVAQAALSRAAIQAGELARAEEAAGMCHSLKPDDPLGLRALAEVELRTRHLDNALRHAEAAKARAPRDPECWLLLGRVHMRAERDVEAFFAFGAALDLDPAESATYDHEVPHAWMAEFALRHGEVVRDGVRLPSSAKQLLAQGRIVGSETSMKRPLVAAIVLVLGGVWLVAGLVDPQIEDPWANVAFGVAAVAFGVWLLARVVRDRRALAQRLPLARLKLFEDARQARLARGHALPVVGVALLGSGVADLLGGEPDPTLTFFTASAGLAALLVWVRAARIASANRPWTEEETLVRRARARLAPLAGLVLVVSTLASAASFVTADERSSAVSPIGWVLWWGVGAWLLARWWRARRAVLRMPGGRQLLVRPLQWERAAADPAELRRRTRAWWQPLLALYLGSVASAVIAEGIRGGPDGDGSAFDPAAIGLGSVLLGVALWLLVRWLAARSALRRAGRVAEAAAARRERAR